MLKRPSAQVRQLASECFAREAGLANAPQAVSSVSAAAFRKLRARVSSVIGGLGFDALFRRSIALAQATYPKFERVSASADAFADLARFESDADSTEIANFDMAVLANIVFLLATLVGETLTKRLLQELWPDLNVNVDLLAADEESAR